MTVTSNDVVATEKDKVVVSVPLILAPPAKGTQEEGMEHREANKLPYKDNKNTLYLQ